MIAEIEHAMCTRIASANNLGILGYHLHTVAPYQGELEDIVARTRIKKALPACFVSFVEEKGQGEHSHESYAFEGLFAVIIIAQTTYNGAATRHDTTGDVGSYQILRDIRLLLSGQRLGLQQGRLQPEETTVLFSGMEDEKSLSILRLTFSMPYKQIYIVDNGLPAALSWEMAEEAKKKAEAAQRLVTPLDVIAAGLHPAPLLTITGQWMQPQSTVSVVRFKEFNE